MSRLLRLITLWLWGGFIYYCVEMLWRGYSHPSMYIVGGCCFLLIGWINNRLAWEMGFVWQCAAGGIGVTLAELVSGLIINRWMGLGVWDYSGMPFNVLWQICLPYTFAWMALSAAGIGLDDFLRWKLYGERKPEYRLV